MFVLQTDAQFVDPNENQPGNYISAYEAVDLLQKFEQKEQRQLNQTSGVEKQNDSYVGENENPSSSSLTADDDLLVDGIQLDSDNYLKLSQYVGGQNPFQHDGAGDDYNNVLFGVLANQQGKDRSKDIKQSEKLYRSVARNLAQSSPQSPDVITSRGPYAQQQRQGPQPTVNRLMNAWQEASMMKNRTSEELHRQVFEEEQGFLKQSKLFRESLSDSSKAREAMARRHAAAYEARQTTAQAKLEKQMQEMQAILQSKQQANCPLCDCIMSPETWEMSRKIYQGKPVCDICYAEKCLVERRRPDPQIRRNYRSASWPGSVNGWAGESPPFRRDLLGREAPPPASSEKPRDAGQAPGMPKDPAKFGFSTKPLTSTLSNLTPLSKNPNESSIVRNKRTFERKEPSNGNREKQGLLSSTANGISNGGKHSQDPQSFCVKNTAVPSEGERSLRADENTLAQKDVNTQQVKSQVSEKIDGDWVKSKDPETGKVFYWNRESNKIRFDDPMGAE